MFQGLENIVQIDLSNLDAAKVTSMESMFSGCRRLQKINFGNINTSSVNNMESLFSGCSLLTSIDLSNFDTSKVETMKKMFLDCSNIKNINFGDIDTSSVGNLESLFSGCSSIEYLNLSGFDTNKVTNIKFMFDDCVSLNCLNLKKFKFIESVDATSAFKNVPQNAKYCIEDVETIPKLKNNIISNCDEICFKELKQKEFFLDNCMLLPNIYKYNNTCYPVCPNNTYAIYNNIEKKIIDIFADNSNKIELDIFNQADSFSEKKINTKIDNKIECYDKTPEGYYLDIENKVYKKCFETCKFCDGKGNKTINNCKECISNFTFLNETQYNTNCYEKCEYYYFNESNEYHCTKNYDCPEQYNKLIINKSKCIDECKNDESYKYEYNNNCYQECPNGTYILEKKQDNKCYDQAIEGYYLNLDKKIFEECYTTCKTCIIGGDKTNNNCSRCKEEFMLYKNNMNISNCYEKCDYYYYFDELNEYHCNATCPEKYKLILNKSKCIDYCENDDIYKYEYNNTCYRECPNGTYKLEVDNYICYDEAPEGYYLDRDEQILKKCYETCYTCDIGGNKTNHNCKECTEDLYF